MTIGQRIKKIRLFRGMTQKELGNILGFGAHVVQPRDKNGTVRSIERDEGAASG